MALSSSVTSMPTGHHVMQRPHPTHPSVPNCPCHDANLCDSHWRYRDRNVGRRLPPWTCENAAEKHESHTRSRSPFVHDRSHVSSTVEQKHVGQTIVQFAHARHRVATSFHS